MRTQTLEHLITDYLEQVKKATDLLEQVFGTKNIIGLWRSKKIPQRGTVAANITYELHGIGCSVYLSEICVDFDYGPDDRVDGFDSWRLYMYACETPSKYKKHTDKQALEREFNAYLKKGKAKKIEGSTSNLYFIQS
ncbi:MULTISPECIES: DUF6896 domain-containing protein [Pseudomonas]|uniref:DUF6896 domain-containing protein n=1 Tax=Pseudomonas lactis TaxID=1615674 RepID=A0A7Y1M4B8_9PSED|nr:MULTISPECIES: hypothetical protein [Pseudomonas]KRP78308.1 hypothetical protein TX24_19195 [Pseudomonas lactis]MDI3249256.1 hypothetical protein [Pseudomonas sp. AL10]MDI3265220.1 hypothetical protein [Pseudomonas sp. AL15]NNA74862.1 hypothetical protein [Pseudomonas lactis]NNA81282.1 hypothetical protein [Pseudomonas lactis]